MPVGFHLSAQDQNKVEDFLARSPQGVAAITLHAKTAQRQKAAAEAAREHSIDVLYDPRTDRMAAADPDGQLTGLAAYSGEMLNLDALAEDPKAREQLAVRTIEAHPAAANIVTPPWFFIDSERSARLVVDLAEVTRLASDRPVRPILMLGSRVRMPLVATIADELARAGMTDVDVRVSPTAGETDSLQKVRRVFAVLDEFTSRNYKVNLGLSGNLGQVAVALGHATTYSVGIGQGEHVNHSRLLRRQTHPAPKRYDEDGKVKRGQWEGIYLPGIAATLSKKVATELLGHSDIRTRIGCRIDACGNSVSGPLQDSRLHYLHARSSEIHELDRKPASWRAQAELERLQRAFSIRKLINERYRPTGAKPLPVRTIESLLNDIREEQAA